MRNQWTSLALGLCALAVGCSDPSPQGQAEGVEQESTDGAARDTGKLWVSSERLSRHTCPSTKCGVVGQFFFREGVDPLEEQDGWVRVSRVYDASCKDGRSEYVDEGNAACDPGNGITGGKFAEWVEKSGLVAERPSDPADTATADESLIAGSDDFARYRKSFTEIAARLIAEGRCTAEDFKEMGGFVKSVTDYRNEPVYFTYCGGLTASNKVYVNAKTGETVN